jgi:hypothetical protein
MKESWLYRTYLILGVMYVIVKIIYVSLGYLHLGAIAHGAIPAVLTLLAGTFTWRASNREKNSHTWNRILLILPILAFVITPLFMYLKMGPGKWLTEGRASVLAIYLFMAAVQSLIAFILLRKHRKQ